MSLPDQIKIDARKDCRGVGCPMNMVYAKVELARLAPGQHLEILLDDGPPSNNVPRSVSREGHQVVTRTRQPDGCWAVVIRKKVAAE